MGNGPRWHWPTWAPFLPCGEDLLDRADHVFEMVADVDGAPAHVLESLWNGSLKAGIPFFLGMIWQSSPPDQLQAARVLECFTFMTMKLEAVKYIPGRKVVVCVQACTWPMAEQMVETCEAMPRDGATHFVWKIGVLYPWWLKPTAPAIEPFFQWMFDASLRALVQQYQQPHGATYQPA